MISAHLYNVPTLHNALKIQLLCNKIAATLCYKVVQGGNSFKSKVVTRLCTGSSNQVTTLSNNLVTKLPHPCHKLGISIWDIYIHVYRWGTKTISGPACALCAHAKKS